jgi:hypothetical protein
MYACRKGRIGIYRFELSKARLRQAFCCHMLINKHMNPSTGMGSSLGTLATFQVVTLSSSPDSFIEHRRLGSCDEAESTRRPLLQYQVTQDSCQLLQLYWLRQENVASANIRLALRIRTAQSSESKNLRRPDAILLFEGADFSGGRETVHDLY